MKRQATALLLSALAAGTAAAAPDLPDPAHAAQYSIHVLGPAEHRSDLLEICIVGMDCSASDTTQSQYVSSAPSAAQITLEPYWTGVKVAVHEKTLTLTRHDLAKPAADGAQPMVQECQKAAALVMGEHLVLCGYQVEITAFTTAVAAATGGK